MNAIHKHTKNDTTAAQDAVSLLTCGDLERRWKKCRMSLWRMRRDGVLPSYRIGSSVRFKLDDVLAIEQQSVC